MSKPPPSGILLLLFPFLFSGISDFRVPGPGERIVETDQALAGVTKSIVNCSPLAAKSYTADSPEEILTNDNRMPAGQLLNGILHLNLEIRTGTWYPESHEGLPIKVYAFAEAGKPMQLPGPLIRVPEGTEIRVTVRNLIIDTPLVLYGLHTRPSDEKKRDCNSLWGKLQSRLQSWYTGYLFLQGYSGYQKVGWLTLFYLHNQRCK